MVADKETTQPQAGFERMLSGMRIVEGLIVATLLILISVAAVSISAADKTEADIAAWGADHVGQPFPEYVTGDECLFCHRTKIGPAWNENVHQQTVRRASPDDTAVQALSGVSKQSADDTDFLMGSKRLTRFLRRSTEYGKLDLLTEFYRPSEHDIAGHDFHHDGSPEWDSTTFASKCAGCHTTAADTETGAFAATSLDCVSCHGTVDLEHTSDVSKVFLSSLNREAKQVISACGQCHLRGGESRSSGQPWPATFVAGDNLFRDFEVDFSEGAIDQLSIMDQHIFLNSRDVATGKEQNITCLTCHDVHGQSTEKHMELNNTAICASCHIAESENSRLRPGLEPAKKLENHSKTCQY